MVIRDALFYKFRLLLTTSLDDCILHPRISVGNSFDRLPPLQQEQGKQINIIDFPLVTYEFHALFQSNARWACSRMRRLLAL